MSSLSKEKMVAGAAWSTIGKVVAMLANFVVTTVIARALSPADCGIYFVALTTIVIVAGIGALGMDQVVVRFAGTAEARSDKAVMRQVIACCYGIVAIGAVVVALAFYALAPVMFRSVLSQPGLLAYAGILAAWVFFATLQRQEAETFRGLNDIRMTTLAGGMRNGGVLNALLVCVGLIVLWASGKLTLNSAMLTMLVASIVLVIYSAAILWRRLRPDGSSPTRTGEPVLNVRKAIHEGWPLGLSGFIVILNNMGSTWLASPLDTANHVALFGVAQRVMQVLIAPMMIVNAILPPIVAELHANGSERRLERVVQAVGGLVLLPSLVVLAILVVAGRPILGAVFGSYYEAAYPILVLVCIGQTMNIATGAWQIVLPMTGNKHRMLTSSVIAVVTQLVLGLILGSKAGFGLGVLGVAIAYCASITITNLAGMVLVHRKLGVWTYASLNWRTVRDAYGMLAQRVNRKLAVQRS